MHVLSVHIEAFKRGMELLSQMLAKKNVRLIFQGQDAYTDNNTIVVPEVALLARKNMTREEVKEAEEFLAALRGYVDHEVGHVLFSEWDSMKAVKQRSDKLFRVVNFMEDPRIEKKMADLWVGAGFNLKNTSKYVFDHYDDPKGLRHIQQILTGWSIVARLGYDDPHPLYKNIPPAARRFLESKRVRALVQESLEAPTTKEIVDCAERFLKMLHEEAEEQKEKEKEKQPKQPKGKKGKEKQEGQGDEGDGEGEGEEQGSSGKGKSKKRKGEKEEQEGESGGKGNGDEDEEAKEDKSGSGDGDEETDEESEEAEGSGGSGAEGPNSTDPFDDEDEEESGKAGTSKQPGGAGGEASLADDLNESDEEFAKMLDDLSDAAQLKKQVPNPDPSGCQEYTVYTTVDDHVKPPTLTQAQIEQAKREYTNVLNEVGSSTLGVLQRSLRNFLKARSYSYKVRDLDEGKVDRRRLYRLATGISNNVFMQDVERIELENVCVGLWINESGSMMGQARLAMQVACAFAETLDALGIPFEVCGHTTGTPWAHTRIAQHHLTPGAFARCGTLHVDVFKAFDEPWRAVRHRLTRYSAMSNTYDAEAVKLAARRLLAQPQKRKVLFTLDDGMPEPNYGDAHDMHIEYLKQVVPEIERAGVEIIGVGIETDSVKEFYPRHVIVNDVNELGAVVLEQLRHVLTKKAGGGPPTTAPASYVA